MVIVMFSMLNGVRVNLIFSIVYQGSMIIMVIERRKLRSSCEKILDNMELC